MKGFTLVELLVVIAMIGIFIALLIPLFGEVLLAPIYVVFGWIPFLYHTVPKMMVEPVAFIVGATALVAAIAVTHRLARWGYRQVHEGLEGNGWRLRSSVAGVLLVVFMFTAGIALLGIIHETGWLLASHEPMVEMSSRSVIDRFISANNLKQIGLAASNYHDAHHSLPPGGTFNEYGEMQHSWETYLLPFLENPAKPDLSLPWNHPANAQHFQTLVSVFLSRAFRHQETDEKGYALSHYAANSRLLRGGSTVRMDDVTDGAANTILAGEVNNSFKPWGHPVNWRDPAAGIGQSPEQFGGSPKWQGAQFLMLDGSVRFFPADIDPKVLKALSTPAGGEPVDEKWR